ncbi:hypothetical protein B0T25DRAFT_614222 [Lasiosphaeria hispida]|uniref:Major facilitator superfamily (MFS) profile domain-containing protein n=1 Tax=Lasiosphaeria hispida TaxID=260671 RepID=A0AAJ0HDB6_9PEZI|nr:hypothetical protein B0T25DRAFT_614222 [Lasiosphaeria hispida]
MRSSETRSCASSDGAFCAFSKIWMTFSTDWTTCITNEVTARISPIPSPDIVVLVVEGALRPRCRVSRNLHAPDHVQSRWRWWNRDIHEDVENLIITINYSVKERENQILKLVDDNGFNGKVFFVAASGLLASSYSLFSTNVVTPAISFVSPACGRLGSEPGQVIGLLTLLGPISGMLAMGHLADRAGRKRLYGLELAILIVATMGVVQASEGFTYQAADGSFQRSMDMYAWLAWGRTALGFGIGAGCPISAVIVAEWASTESRGTMLAAVLYETRQANEALTQTEPLEINNARLVVDEMWRTVIGIAIIPAAVAIFARLTIPVCGSFCHQLGTAQELIVSPILTPILCI